MHVLLFGLRGSAGPDGFGLVLAVLQVTIIEDNSPRQRDVDAELGWDFQHVVTVFEDVGGQRAFLWPHDIGGAQRLKFKFNKSIIKI